MGFGMGVLVGTRAGPLLVGAGTRRRPCPELGGRRWRHLQGRVIISGCPHSHRANAEIAQVRGKAQQEQAAYQASLRKEQLRVDALERTLEQKVMGQGGACRWAGLARPSGKLRQGSHHGTPWKSPLPVSSETGPPAFPGMAVSWGVCCWFPSLFDIYLSNS